MKFTKNPMFWGIAGFLAVWRLTNIIQQEVIAAPIRKRIGIFEPDGEDPEHWIYPDNFLGKVFYCFWCGSVWVSIFVVLLMLVFPPIILPFALSAAAIAFREWLDREPPTYIENMWINDDGVQDYNGEDDDAGQ